MPLDQLLLFFTVTMFMSASPGPVMLSCMANGGHYGMRKALFGMAGASLGNLLLMLLSVFGLGLLLGTSSAMFNVLRWIGAAYLVFLGVQIVIKPAQLHTASSARAASSGWTLLIKSVGIAVSNPKGLIYFGALFPPFISPDRSLLPQFLLLTVIFLVLDLIWMLIYAGAGSYIMSWLKTPVHHRWFNWISGGALVVAGALLLLTD